MQPVRYWEVIHALSTITIIIIKKNLTNSFICVFFYTTEISSVFEIFSLQEGTELWRNHEY